MPEKCEKCGGLAFRLEDTFHGHLRVTIRCLDQKKKCGHVQVVKE